MRSKKWTEFPALALCAIALCVASPAPLAHAGWISSGGELTLDSKNPWFVKNVTEVKACLEIDEAHFGASREVARSQVDRAWGLWNRWFAALGEDKGVGLQRLVWQDACEASTDIAFQFGVLHPEQLRELPDITRTIGLAVRTDYNRRTLKGKGFVYFAPERGSLALRSKSLVPLRWSLGEGSLLGLVALHEIGHVFGLQHSSVSSQFDLMAEKFPEYVTSADAGQWIAEDAKKLPDAKWPSPFQLSASSCRLVSAPEEEVRSFWGLSPDATEVMIAIEDGRLIVRESTEPPSDDIFSTPKRLVADAPLNPLIVGGYWLGEIFLPKGQTVFPAQRGVGAVGVSMRPSIGFGLKKTSLSAVRYVTPGAEVRQVHVDERGSETRLTGISNGKLASDLFCGDMRKGLKENAPYFAGSIPSKLRKERAENGR